jgi:molybdate transport system permease protein
VFFSGAVLSGGALLVLLGLPVLALFLRVPPADLVTRLGDPIVLEALRLSFLTSACATLVIVLLGLPLAYVLAARSFPGKTGVEVIVTLPVVLPPTVAGLALLMAFGRTGLAGRALSSIGIQLPFTTVAVVMAQVFMAAPFFVLAARAGIASVDRRYLDAAATLRASEARTLFRVILPLSFRSLAAGAALAFARALGEFGATITFAGNLPGRTQTMPLAVYMALQSDLDAALVLSLLLVLTSIGLLLGLRLAPAGLLWRKADASGRAR